MNDPTTVIRLPSRLHVHTVGELYSGSVEYSSLCWSVPSLARFRGLEECTKGMRQKFELSKCGGGLLERARAGAGWCCFFLGEQEEHTFTMRPPTSHWILSWRHKVFFSLDLKIVLSFGCFFQCIMAYLPEHPQWRALLVLSPILSFYFLIRLYGPWTLPSIAVWSTVCDANPYMSTFHARPQLVLLY